MQQKNTSTKKVIARKCSDIAIFNSILFYLHIGSRIQHCLQRGYFRMFQIKGGTSSSFSKSTQLFLTSVTFCGWSFIGPCPVRSFSWIIFVTSGNEYLLGSTSNFSTCPLLRQEGNKQKKTQFQCQM